MENRHKDFIDSLSVEHAALIVQGGDKPDGLDGLWNFITRLGESLTVSLVVKDQIFGLYLYLFAFL